MLKKTLLSLACAFFYLGSLGGDEIPKLTLNGQASVYKKADQMQFNVGVTSRGQDAESTLKDNSEKMRAILQVLKKNGLNADEYQTGQFTILPTYTPYPQNPPPDWKPSINGYEVTNTLSIKTSQLDKIGLLISAVNAAGANKIDHIQATLKDDKSVREEAIREATKNAITEAEIMAKAAHVQLVRPLSITLNDSYIHPIAPRMMKAFAESDSIPIEPGQIEVKANVTVVYEMRPDTPTP